MISYKPRFQIAVLFALCVSLYSAAATSADTFLHVFYKEAPVEGVAVKIDGEDVGLTDDRGFLETFVSSGEHTMQLTHKETVITDVDFNAELDEEIEISVKYDEQGDGADVTVRNYSVGDSGGAVGFITGTVKNVEQQPIAGAVVSSMGLDASAETDAAGVYLLELPRGLHNLEISHPAYQGSMVSDLRIVADVGVQATATLSSLADPGSTGPSISIAKPDLPAVEEVIILGTFNPTANAIGLERFATNILDALDIGQLERFGDSDVAAALSRIVGVSVTEDKYANVRGLDGRCISSSLNGLMMPSTDPLRRDVQLGLFPSNILDSIEIQKTYSADLLGTTTGGSVRMNTRGLPDERVFKFSIGSGYRQDVTGDRVASHRGSHSDGLGFDGGTRDLSGAVLQATERATRLSVCPNGIDPGDFCDFTQQQAINFGLQFEPNYNVTEKKANPDFSASMSFGDRFELGSMGAGFYTAFSYKHSTSSRGEASLDDILNETGTYRRAKENTAVSAYLVGGLEFREADEVLSKTILLRNTDDMTFRSDYVIAKDDKAFQSTILEFVEREFLSQQFSGKHEFNFMNDAAIVDWRIGYSETQRYEPDRREYVYEVGLNRPDPQLLFTASSLERRWSNLDEDSVDFGLDVDLPFTLTDNISAALKMGVLSTDRAREFELYRYGVIVPFRPDTYEAEETTEAFYLAAHFDIGDYWTLTGGLRRESFEQELAYPDFPDANSSLTSDETLPALNISYRPTDSWQIRGGFSRTVSYPGLIERGLARVNDPETNDIILGNPDLQVSTIDNYDLRVEYYFSDDETISLALFSKDIELPIERAVGDGSGSASLGTVEFRNADKADLLGIELDAYKTVMDLESSSLFVSGNVSWIDSEVSLDADSLRLEGESKQGRELQGQSPWLANLQFGYDHYETEQKVTLLLNYYDDRIFGVARGDTRTPLVEKGRVLVDLNYEKLFGEAITFQAQIKNLLNEKVEYEQNDRIVESYDEGTSFSLSVAYEFF